VEYHLVETMVLTYLFLDPLPDDAGHLITIELNNWVGNLDLAEGGESSLRNYFGQHLLSLSS
jgi:hypothetical protein